VRGESPEVSYETRSESPFTMTHYITVQHISPSAAGSRG